MEEKALIEKYDQLRQSLKEIEINIQYLKEDKFEEQKKVTKQELAEVTEQLKQSEKVIFNAKMQSIQGVLAATIKALKPNTNSTGWRLSLDQSMLFPNYLFFKLINDLEYALKSETGSYPEPYLFYDARSKFDNTELKSLFLQIQKEFQGQQIKDYPELWEFHDQSVTKIANLAAKYS